MDSPGRPPGIIRRPTTGTLQSVSGVSRRSAASGTPTTSRTLVGQSVHWPTPSNEAQYVDEGGRVIRSGTTSNRASETSLRPEQMSRRSTRESIASTLSRGREQLSRRGTDEGLARGRAGSVYLRPAGLRNPNVHLLFVIFRVALAIIADVVVQHGSIPIAMPQQIAIEVQRLRPDYLFLAAIINALFGHVTVYYQILTSRGPSVFVFWILLRVVWKQICAPIPFSLLPFSFSLQSFVLAIGSYCLAVSLYHTDNVWAENDLDLVDYNDAVARMNLARGF